MAYNVKNNAVTTRSKLVLIKNSDSHSHSKANNFNDLETAATAAAGATGAAAAKAQPNAAAVKPQNIPFQQSSSSRLLHVGVVVEDPRQLNIKILLSKNRQRRAR